MKKVMLMPMLTLLGSAVANAPAAPSVKHEDLDFGFRSPLGPGEMRPNPKKVEANRKAAKSAKQARRRNRR